MRGAWAWRITGGLAVAVLALAGVLADSQAPDPPGEKYALLVGVS
jgi:hypothetical protein